MRLTVRQYYDLPSAGPSLSGSASAWDKLRLSGADDPFSLPPTREAWIAKAARQDADIPERAKIIAAIAREHGLSHIVSYGVGAGWLEYYLKQVTPGFGSTAFGKHPSFHLTACDIAPESVERLRKVFTECDEIIVLDCMKDNWPELPRNALHLMHRIDSEFSTGEWRTIFARLHKINAEHVLLIAPEILSEKQALRRMLKNALRQRASTFCGWLRTKDAYTVFWKPYYRLTREVRVGNLTGFLLRNHP